MNLNEKKYIEDIILTISKSIEQAKNNINYVQQSFDDCIYASKIIVEFLEKEKRKEYSQFIFKFSDFFDLLNILKNTNLNKEERIEELDIILTFIDKILTDFKNLKLKKNILFMPYKASMWTSLESIWKAACEDESCNPIVVLLPYYELDSSGNKIKLCYEIDKFNKKLNIVDYKEINLNEIRPNIVFIHNPYDENNTLTRIPEEFYIDNLKKYSKYVIYSPYFTFGNYENNIESISFYLAQTNNKADKIIIQSKRVADILKVFNYPNSKMIISGTPKTDAIINKMKENIEIPKIWKEKLKARKIFLLNTHLLYFQKGYYNNLEGEDYAQKYHKEIIETFINRNDCALIWRPHPLLKSSLQNQYQQCLPFFKEMERKINESTNCIIDESGDYSIAFRLSSAMITTNSSLINEYMVTKKPILIFDKAPKEEDAKISPINYLVNYFRNEPDNIRFENFIDMVLNNQDPKRDERIKEIKNSFLNLNGTAGKKAYEEACRYLDEMNKI